MKHKWRLMGGAGGWEVWDCTTCNRSAIPTIFGFMWPWPKCKELEPSKCEHLFVRRWVRDRNKRWACVNCGMETRSYDSVDRQMARPIHKHMSVAVRGYNTTKEQP